MTTNLPSTLAHSTLGASTSDRWGNCPGSVRLSVGIESKTSVYAEEGTFAHEVAQVFLSTGGWLVRADEEMVANVKVYTDLIHAESKGGKLFVEQRLDLSSIHPKMFGTADAVIYYEQQKLLRVYDLKYGQGHVVDVKDNPQLKYYALGAMLMLNLPVETVETVIVQPRAFHADGPIRRQSYDAFDMLDFSADLAALAKRTEDPNAPLVSGDHCRWCPAAGICPKLREQAALAAKEEFSPAKPYDPARLSEVLNWLDVFEAWAKSVRAFAYAEAEAGRTPPGHKLVQKRAIRKWLGGVDADMLAKEFGIDRGLFLEIELKSPPAAEKLLTKAQKPLLEEFILKASSGLALVSDSDPRPAVAMTTAEEEFTAIGYDPFV